VLEKLSHFFEETLRGAAAEDSPQDRERALRLATAALLFEIVRADGRVDPRERDVMRAAVHSSFDLAGHELDELIAQAEEASRNASSLYEFTHLVDQGFSPEQKKRIVELLWLITFADGQKDALEEHLVRRIAGLLHVPHPDFIDAKIRARGEASRGDVGGEAL
jgi:uncharacterized tellurite resistance protein B-like protein